MRVQRLVRITGVPRSVLGALSGGYAREIDDGALLVSAEHEDLAIAEVRIVRAELRIWGVLGARDGQTVLSARGCTLFRALEVARDTSDACDYLRIWCCDSVELEWSAGLVTYPNELLGSSLDEISIATNGEMVRR